MAYHRLGNKLWHRYVPPDPDVLVIYSYVSVDTILYVGDQIGVSGDIISTCMSCVSRWM